MRWRAPVLWLVLTVSGCTRESQRSESVPCHPDITVPAGFCATIFADNLGSLRHIAVRANGDVYVARWSSSRTNGALVALRDTNSDGRADRIETVRNDGGSGIAIVGDTVYMSTWKSVLRYVLRPGELAPRGAVDTLLANLPPSGHAARSLVADGAGNLFVTIGAPTNSCQADDRVRGSLGRDPCPERNNFAGVWRFDTRRLKQRQSDGEKIVSGVRHAVAFAMNHSDSTLYAVQHGRDELHEDFPAIYSERRGHELPAEVMFRLVRGADFGWPYCYYDDSLRQTVLAPEYGGDGVQTGRCSHVPSPFAAFPAHWAPNGLLFHSGKSFPEKYSHGALIAFHGSWVRPPPYNGFVVVFQPLSTTGPSAGWEIFADGFAGSDKRPPKALHRPVGLAEGPDGALFITDDVRGTIWRVTRN